MLLIGSGTEDVWQDAGGRRFEQGHCSLRVWSNHKPLVDNPRSLFQPRGTPRLSLFDTYRKEYTQHAVQHTSENTNTQYRSRAVNRERVLDRVKQPETPKPASKHPRRLVATLRSCPCRKTPCCERHAKCPETRDNSSCHPCEDGGLAGRGAFVIHLTACPVRGLLLDRRHTPLPGEEINRPKARKRPITSGGCGQLANAQRRIARDELTQTPPQP